MTSPRLRGNTSLCLACCVFSWGFSPAWAQVSAPEISTPAPADRTACDTATGRLLQVGPGKVYAVPSAAAAIAESGDVIKIDAGIYDGDVVVDTPNGGIVTLPGNLFHKGPNADNSIAIAYGQEGLKHAINTLQLTHNTIVSTHSGGYYLAAQSSTQSVRLTANLFAGDASLITGFASGSVIQQANKLTSASAFSGADNVVSPNFWPGARLRSEIALGDVPDTGYTKDAPKPFVTRAIRGTRRLIGALQAVPQWAPP